MTTSRSTEFRNIQNIVLKLPHGHFMGDLHTSSMSLSFLYVSVHSADLLGNTSELAFRWIALLLSLQTRRLTEGSSIAPAPYSKEQEEIRETSPFFWSFFGDESVVSSWSFSSLKKQQTQPPIQPLPIPPRYETPKKTHDVKGVRVRKKRHVFAAMFAGREAPNYTLVKSNVPMFCL